MLDTMCQTIPTHAEGKIQESKGMTLTKHQKQTLRFARQTDEANGWIKEDES